MVVTALIAWLRPVVEVINDAARLRRQAHRHHRLLEE
jgi:hypothetical protein